MHKTERTQQLVDVESHVLNGHALLALRERQRHLVQVPRHVGEHEVQEYLAFAPLVEAIDKLHRVWVSHHLHDLKLAILTESGNPRQQTNLVARILENALNGN